MVSPKHYCADVDQFLPQPQDMEHAIEALLASELFKYHTDRMMGIVMQEAQEVSGSLGGADIEYKPSRPIYLLSYHPVLRVQASQYLQITSEMEEAVGDSCGGGQRGSGRGKPETVVS